MNRRGFLGAIAAGLVLDPERLLWRPGAKLISIPRPQNPYEALMDYWAGHDPLVEVFNRFQATQASRLARLESAMRDRR